MISPDDLVAVRTLMNRAFAGRFDDDDWTHAIGGDHVVVRVDGMIVAHGSVVSRRLVVGESDLNVGYVEAVATEPALQGRGHGTEVMRELAAIIESRFDLGALCTGSPRFYERLGWEVWKGPSFVDTPSGRRRTPDDDGAIMVLRCGLALDTSLPIICDWRAGDVW